MVNTTCAGVIMMHYEQMEELIEVGEHWCKSILSAPQRKMTLFHGATRRI